MCTLYFKVLFMSEQNQQFLPAGQAGLETLQDIRRIMERSSRFISLSGLSGVAAGICALVGAWIARGWLKYDWSGSLSGTDFQVIKMRLLILAVAVLAAALVTAFYFTWRKARHNNLPVKDLTAKRLTIIILIPLVAVGLFIIDIMHYI